MPESKLGKLKSWAGWVCTKAGWLAMCGWMLARDVYTHIWIQTRVYTVAGYYSTTRPLVLIDFWLIFHTLVMNLIESEADEQQKESKDINIGRS